ncbi:MAG: class II aldolase/adducin family protein [Chloroflexi bacterium]|nr:class II aldolase/adducin family protein [Chloroflexota bacterium]
MSLYTSSKETALREQIVRVGRLMYDHGLIVGVDGNISARLSDSRILVTPSGLCKGLMTPEQVIVVDLEGNKVGSETGVNRSLRPTSETRMHLEVYRQRSDVGGVVHAHPCTAIALSIAGIQLADRMIPEAIVNLGLVPTTEYATPASDENVYAIRDLIAGHDGIILQRHGTLTVGKDPWQAFVRTEFLEQVARITMMLRQLGAGEPIPADEVRKLLAQREAFGFMRPGELEEFADVYGTSFSEQTGAEAQQQTTQLDEEALIKTITDLVLQQLRQDKKGA